MKTIKSSDMKAERGDRVWNWWSMSTRTRAETIEIRNVSNAAHGAMNEITQKRRASRKIKTNERNEGRSEKGNARGKRPISHSKRHEGCK